MSVQKKTRFNYYSCETRLEPIPELSEAEVFILIPAKCLMNGMLYPIHQDCEQPATLEIWNHPWPIVKGYARLRLNELNGNRGSNFCDFNINESNLSDYNSIDNERLKGKAEQLLSSDGPVSERVNSMVDMSSCMVYMTDKTNIFSFNIWDALVNNEAKIVVTK
jgi:hypothetical protein